MSPYLQEVPDVGVGPLGVGPRDLEEGALLAHHHDVHDLTDEVALPGPQHQEVRLRHLVEVDGSPEQVVLKRLGEEERLVYRRLRPLEVSYRDNKTP